MSDLHAEVGAVPGYGNDIKVCRHPDGSAAITVSFGVAVSVPPESVAALAQLLDRAAMPGRVKPAYRDCCGHCEHNGESGPDLDAERHPNPCPHGCPSRVPPA